MVAACIFYVKRLYDGFFLFVRIQYVCNQLLRVYMLLFFIFKSKTVDKSISIESPAKTIEYNVFQINHFESSIDRYI